jgi:O-acetylserine/cysteine efflux transporter
MPNIASRHRLAAVDAALLALVAFIWGFNFVVVAVGLKDFPPILFSALRFLICAIPAVFFCRNQT